MELKITDRKTKRAAKNWRPLLLRLVAKALDFEMSASQSEQSQRRTEQHHSRATVRNRTVARGERERARGGIRREDPAAGRIVEPGDLQRASSTQIDKRVAVDVETATSDYQTRQIKR